MSTGESVVARAAANERLDVHGFGAVVLAQATWLIAGLELRGDGPRRPQVSPGDTEVRRGTTESPAR